MRCTSLNDSFMTNILVVSVKQCHLENSLKKVRALIG